MPENENTSLNRPYSSAGNSYEETLRISREIESIMRQANTTDSSDGGSMGAMNAYSNRVFGAPYQLLNSVDRRFSSVNSNLGLEYLRQFIMNGPILYIKPGMPHYTGGDKGFFDRIRENYISIQSGADTGWDVFLSGLANDTIFGAGGRLQRRMFGIRETYYDYMQHVNYMCRSVATFMGLTSSGEFPNYTFDKSGSPLYFETASWENYRMLASDRVLSPGAFLQEIIFAATDQWWMPSSSMWQNLFTNNDGQGASIDSLIGAFAQGVENQRTVYDAVTERSTSVQFMVEPVSFEETYSNETATSVIEKTIDGLTDLGSEIAFITNSRADTGLVGNLAGLLGDVTGTAATQLNGLINPAGGGFLTNVFSGALAAIKGQKMIYPEIYKSSRSTMDYNFSITLTSPYGDMYNYYMNIVVPLMHLIALAAPRMVTSNTISSPFIVQAYIPGMVTCQMGIISNLTVTKNPSTKHVSVNGYPLTVKVSFTIKELYNAMAISPANDPASYTYNETLNDYLCNAAGLVPSQETKAMQRANAWDNTKLYFGDLGNAISREAVNALEGFFRFFDNG